MAESTLSMGFADLQERVGHYLGFGRVVGNYSADQVLDVNAMIRDGYRDYLGRHDWSFLRTSGSIVTVANTQNYTLPDDFGWMKGVLTYSSNTFLRDIIIVGEGKIRQLDSIFTSTGFPEFAAINPISNTQVTGQRWEISFHPTPDSVFTINFEYSVLTGELTALLPFHLGGMQHSQTVMMACISMAENFLNDSLDVKRAEYERLLAESIRIDGERSPDTLGYNGDHSDGNHGHFHRLGDVLFNGSPIT